MSYSLNIPSTVNAHGGALRPKVQYTQCIKSYWHIVAELYLVYDNHSTSNKSEWLYSECFLPKTQYTHLLKMVLVVLLTFLSIFYLEIIPFNSYKTMFAWTLSFSCFLFPHHYFWTGHAIQCNFSTLPLLWEAEFMVNVSKCRLYEKY